MYSSFFFLNFNIYFIILIYINIINYKTYSGKNLTFNYNYSWKTLKINNKHNKSQLYEKNVHFVSNEI